MKLNLRKVKQPKWSAPMLATLSKQVFSDQDWIYERKLDGMQPRTTDVSAKSAALTTCWYHSG